MINNLMMTMTDSEFKQLNKKLCSIGKAAFVKYLYPELKRNIDISEVEISEKYPLYAGYSDNARKTRLSNSRSILKNGLGKEALMIIVSSLNLPEEIRDLARKYLDEE